MKTIGWIKLHRKLLNWEWWGDHNTTILFIYLLLKANHEDKKWKGITCKRGQVITGLHKINQQTSLPIQKIRTSIKRLKSTNEITTKSTNKFTIITLNNWDDYQLELTSKSTSKLTNNQQTTNKQLTTNKNYKNVKNDKNIRKINFDEFGNHFTVRKSDGQVKPIKDLLKK